MAGAADVNGWGDRAARAWTSLYTRRLAADIADRRRREIDSDLYEHSAVVAPGPAQQIAVIGRVLWGIPADLSWRRAARASHPRRVATGDKVKLNRVTQGIVALLCLFIVWIGVGTLTADGAGPLYSVALIAAAGVIGVGLYQRTSAPRRSTVMIVVGAAVPVAVFYWMVPVFLPVWILVSVLVVVTEPGRGRRQLAT